MESLKPTWTEYLIPFSQPNRWAKAPVWVFPSAMGLSKNWVAESKSKVLWGKVRHFQSSFRFNRMPVGCKIENHPVGSGEGSEFEKK